MVEDLEIEIASVERVSSSYSQSGRLERSGSREIRSTWFQLDPDRAPRTTVVFSLSPPELGPFCDVVLVTRDGDRETNRDADNLFDVTIPHLTVSRPFTLERTIATQAGVRFGFPDATFPGDYFPHHHENATLGELLEEYLAHHPDGRRVRLDRDTHHLGIPEPFNLQDYLKGRWKDLRKRVGF